MRPAASGLALRVSPKKLPEGYKHFGGDDYAKLLCVILENNPFYASSLTPRAGGGFEIINYDPDGKTYSSRVMRTIGRPGPRVNVKFSVRMNGLQKQLSSASSSLPRERAKPPQIDAFKAAIEQVRVALEDDCAALISSSVLKTLFHSSIGAAIHFNRSDARLENDPEQGALFESIATIEEVVKTPSEEAALLKAGVVKAVPHLLSVLLSTEDDVECREAAVSCLIGAPRPTFAPRPACAPRPAGWPTHTRGILVRQS